MRALPSLIAIIATGLPMSVLPMAAQALEIAPHKGVYDLVLDRGNAVRGVEDIKGRIVFEGGGSLCDGYTATFRQVVRMTGSEMPERLTDVRSTSFEEPGGKSFRFVIEKFINGQPDGKTEGKTAGDGQVKLTRPKPEDVALPAGVTFPTHHTRALIEAAMAGDSTHTTKTYDGSDEGRAIYDTTSVIGKPIRADVAADAPDAAQVKSLSGLTRWPVIISYFKHGTGDMNPAYTMSMELYENGVARALRLDYGTLALKGTLSALELGKMPKC